MTLALRPAAARADACEPTRPMSGAHEPTRASRLSPMRVRAQSRHVRADSAWMVPACGWQLCEPTRACRRVPMRVRAKSRHVRADSAWMGREEGRSVSVNLLIHPVNEQRCSSFNRRWYIHQTRAGRDLQLPKGGAEMSLRSRPTRAKGVLRARSGRVCGAAGALMGAGASPGDYRNPYISMLQPHYGMAQREDSYSCRRQSTNTAVRSGGRQRKASPALSPTLGVWKQAHAERVSSRTPHRLVGERSSEGASDWRVRRCAFETRPPTACIVCMCGMLDRGTGGSPCPVRSRVRRCRRADGRRSVARGLSQPIHLYATTTLRHGAA